MEGNSTIDLASYREQVFNIAPATTEPPAETTPPEETVTEPTPPTPEPIVTAPEPVVVTPPAEEESTMDVAAFLKEQFGWENLEVAKNEVQELKKLKEAPASQPLTPEQEKLLYNLKNGNRKEIKEYLETQDLIANVDNFSNEQKLKTFIKLQNPLFDNELVEDEYDATYKINEDEYDDPLKLRKEKVKLQQRIENDVKRATDYFSQLKNVQLPEIPKTEIAPDPDYVAFRNYATQYEQEHVVLESTLSKLSPDSIAIKQSFNDEANKIKFDFEYKLDKNGFEKARQAAANYVEYLGSNYFNADGSPQAEKLITDIYIGQNREKFIADIQKEAVNKTITWFLANQKNIGDGIQKQQFNPAKTDLDNLKAQVFGQ